MAINTALLISAAILQDYLVNKDDGLPLANGTITLYQDNSRTTFKNWYTQTGSPGAYTYVPLPNPMTLSGVGTMQDANGNDIIPFYYPYSETDNQTPQPYYVVVMNSNGEQQFTRQNFPFNPIGSSPVTNPTQRNYLANNVFWRNIGSANVTSVTSMVLAPSQHDGFSMPDIQFLKDITGATDNITFQKFIAGDGAGQVLNNDITPEYYINFNCSAAQIGETLKCIQIPISLHIKTLENVEASVVIHAQNVGGSTNNNLTLFINQFLGTGVSSPAPITIQKLTLNSNWTKFVISFIFPSAAGLTLGAGGDDALYLQIGLPLGVTCNINFTKPQIYLSTEVPDNDFDTYDDIDTIINSARTGDIRTSVNSFYPFGWAPMNDKTIGDASSNATSRANQDTWQLFNLLWSIAKPYDVGGGSHFNPICQMFNSGGSTIDFGASAYADFTANNALALTRMLGRVIIGTSPPPTIVLDVPQNITASNDGGGNLLITIINPAFFWTGQPIVFATTGSLPGNITAGIVYYVSNFNSGTSSFNVSTTFANAMAQTWIAFSSAGSNSTVTSYILGSSEGEYAHVQLGKEVGAHIHPPGGAGTNFVESFGAASVQSGASLALNDFANTGINTPNSTPFNIVQPSTFYNVFIKL